MAPKKTVVKSSPVATSPKAAKATTAQSKIQFKRDATTDIGDAATTGGGKRQKAKKSKESEPAFLPAPLSATAGASEAPAAEVLSAAAAAGPDHEGGPATAQSAELASELIPAHLQTSITKDENEQVAVASPTLCPAEPAAQTAAPLHIDHPPSPTPTSQTAAPLHIDHPPSPTPTLQWGLDAWLAGDGGGTFCEQQNWDTCISAGSWCDLGLLC